MMDPQMVGAAAAASAERVRRFLEARGLADGIVEFKGSTKTARAAADAMGCALGQIAKSLVFVTAAGPVLVLVAGDRRGDAGAIARETGSETAAFADPETVLRATGYAAGSVSPFDLPGELPVLIDESLGRYETVYPAAGTDASMVGLTFTAMVAVTGGRVCAVGQAMS